LSSITKMGCLSCINKTVLLVLNLLLFLIGLGLVIVSAISLHLGSEFGEVLESGHLTFPIILLIVGIFILLLGFLGCCGAQKENACMLYTYSTVLLILVIAQFACGIILVTNKDTAEDTIKEGMWISFNKYGNPNDTHFTEVVDKLQNELKCCGVEGPEDWKNATYLDDISVPDGCCKDMKKGCGKGYFDHVNAVEIYEDGCYDIIRDEIMDLGVGIAGLIFIAAGVQLIIVIMACVLAKGSNRKEYEKV